MATPKRSESEKAKILTEARERFRKCESWEATFRGRFKEDIRLDAADAYNQWQWPTDVLNARTNQPCLTINKIRQHNLDVLNDARQSKISIKVRALRDGASYDSAQIYDGVIRHIEYISNADSAYQHALAMAVRGGIGFIRISTDYADDKSFDQEIFIRRVKDPMTVYLDPDITEFDGSDARFGFVFTDMPKDEFDRTYPKLKDVARNTELKPEESWADDEHVKVAEYFRCVKSEKRRVAFTDPQTGQQVVATEDEIDEAMLDSVIDAPDTMIRSIELTTVEHFLIVGDTIAEEKEWPGRYIPLLRCVGEETIIDGQMDRKGHTRALIDPQRMFNYNASASIEYGALQSKIPYTAAVESIEGYEPTWEAANTNNAAVLPYKAYNDQGQVLPKPERQQPPMGAPVFMQGMNDAAEWMRMASGQYQADMGAPSNERSGVAIQQRQRQGDNATYHYLDHQSSMIRYAGKQLLDLIPKVYDTPRLIRIRDEAGTETEVNIDPNAAEPFNREKVGPDQDKVTFNPKAGSYDVIADVGAAYATRRQEAFAAYTQILTQNKELTGLIGDIAMRFADFPGAEEAAQRLRRMVPKQALEDGPSPDVQALQQRVQQMQMVVDQLNDKLASKVASHVNDQERNAIQAYDSQTKRIAALKEQLATDPQDLLMLVREVLTSALSTEAALEPALDTTAAVEPTGPAQDAALAQGEGAPVQSLPPSGFDPSVIHAPGAPEPEPQEAPEGVDA
jgi:hypothetical protein